MCGCLRKKSRFKAVGWRGGVCSRVRESLSSSIQGCYLLEIQHIFFFFLIDFSRVGGKTLQMRKKKARCVWGGMQAWQEGLEKTIA